MWVHFRVTRGDGTVGTEGVTKCCHREHQTPPQPLTHLGQVTPLSHLTPSLPGMNLQGKGRHPGARCAPRCVCVWRSLFPVPFAPAN